MQFDRNEGGSLKLSCQYQWSMDTNKRVCSLYSGLVGGSPAEHDANFDLWFKEIIAFCYSIYYYFYYKTYRPALHLFILTIKLTLFWIPMLIYTFEHVFLVTVSRMGKDPTKPRGKMSSYAYFVQTCREEHKKKHPDASVNFSEFSKKCSERWKVG